MPNNSQKNLRIFLAILSGAILTGLCNFLWLYFVTYKFETASSGLGITFTREFNALFGGVFGTFFLIITGTVLGLVIGIRNLNKIQSISVGSLVNGFVTALLVASINIRHTGVLFLSHTGNFVIGGVAGLMLFYLVFIINKKTQNEIQ